MTARAALRALALPAAYAVHAACAAAPAAEAARPVRIVVPFLGGSLADGVARILARRLTAGAGRPFVVENRFGDDGHFGAEIVSKAEPDGYTVLFAPITNYAAAVSLRKTLHYDLAADFAPVGLIADAPHVLAAHPSVPAKTVGELIAIARARPGQLRWASHGARALSQLEIDMFRRLTGVKVTGVPYANSADALPALLEGNVDLLFDSIAATLPPIASGRLRALAVAGARRSPALARVPTLAEAGVKGFDADYWYGILAPGGTGKDIIDRLQREFAAAARDADVKQELLRHGIEPLAGPSGELARITRAEIAKWAAVVKDAGLAPE